MNKLTDFYQVEDWRILKTCCRIISSKISYTDPFSKRIQNFF